ncbi:hypothetical protein NMY22_g20116 [Coprinellus aureogranulatus]|nr:hypothetical protein NMY22_g20116 [Coprinellus aureogranulatus]
MDPTRGLQLPHTSRIDSDSDLGSSIRPSVLTRGTTSRSNTVSSTTTGTGTSTTSRRRGTPNRGDSASIASSIRSSARSTATFETSGSGSTVGRSPALRRKVVNGSPSASSSNIGGDGDDSPAKRIAASVRARNGSGKPGSVRSVRSSLRERPDSKLTPEGSMVSSARAGKGPGTPSIVESRLDDDLG